MIRTFAVLRLAVLLLSCTMWAAAAGAQDAEVVFDLKIERGRVPQNMRLIRAKQGDLVKLRWMTDRTILLHLHGYDIESKVEPGAVTEMAFQARVAGRFSVEEHRPNAQGGHSHGETALVRIEIRPR